MASKFWGMVKKERAEHPSLDLDTIKVIVNDHLKEMKRK